MKYYKIVKIYIFMKKDEIIPSHSIIQMIKQIWADKTFLIWELILDEIPNIFVLCIEIKSR